MASGRSSASSKDHRKGRREDPPDVKLSKSLSYVCRHGAVKLGIQMDSGGFIDVDDLLRLPMFKDYKMEDIQRVVSNNSKQRFALKQEPDSQKTFIRANQGHTVEVEELDLQPITSPSEAPTVVHGTYKRAWDSIKLQGLSKMKRNHIHFAPDIPGGNEVISGMRHNCQILIFIDLKKALEDGLSFYRSANNVILSPGNSEGIILPKYFAQVRELPSGKVLLQN
ncbi:tRNA 2'-phosphotransferase 1-like [Dysidea avara]|uniref:tRNA 2'-phosphotransferase 1-like n=1 Tax=Dysidea avara TaxID=196820 RepID=UPI00331F88D9